MIDYKITINRLIVDTSSNAAQQKKVIGVAVIASHDNPTGGFSTSFVFDLRSEPQPAIFTPYDELQETQVLGWLSSPTLESQHAEIQNIIIRMEEEHRLRTQIGDLTPPWETKPDISNSVIAATNTIEPNIETITGTNLPVLDDARIKALVYQVIEEIESNKL